MENEFIPYEQALTLKELGFDEPCFGTWDKPDKLWTGNPVNGILDIPEDIILAPTYSQAFRWFREKYNEHTILIPYCDSSGEVLSYRFEIVVQDYNLNDFESECKNYTYEEAELECLKKLIEIVKNK